MQKKVTTHKCVKKRSIKASYFLCGSLTLNPEKDLWTALKTENALPPLLPVLFPRKWGFMTGQHLAKLLYMIPSIQSSPWLQIRSFQPLLAQKIETAWDLIFWKLVLNDEPKHQLSKPTGKNRIRGQDGSI